MNPGATCFCAVFKLIRIHCRWWIHSKNRQPLCWPVDGRPSIFLPSNSVHGDLWDAETSWQSVSFIENVQFSWKHRSFTAHISGVSLTSFWQGCRWKMSIILAATSSSSLQLNSSLAASLFSSPLLHLCSIFSLAPCVSELPLQKSPVHPLLAVFFQWTIFPEKEDSRMPLLPKISPTVCRATFPLGGDSWVLNFSSLKAKERSAFRRMFSWLRLYLRVLFELAFWNLKVSCRGNIRSCFCSDLCPWCFQIGKLHVFCVHRWIGLDRVLALFQEGSREGWWALVCICSIEEHSYLIACKWCKRYRSPQLPPSYLQGFYLAFPSVSSSFSPSFLLPISSSSSFTQLSSSHPLPLFPLFPSVFLLSWIAPRKVEGWGSTWGHTPLMTQDEVFCWVHRCTSWIFLPWFTSRDWSEGWLFAPRKSNCRLWFILIGLKICQLFVYRSLLSSCWVFPQKSSSRHYPIFS